ncbi:hypothetical protein M9H77_21966 [Catharanthus roseus]|uniref:Uncharacterized protein n=1 Tax=Catharanthus roseus TaxID=4058 RepID=A0ACC0ARS7_CATRO|nr:hypothetical protein M9H77_21966 [Catharanthus roseus]
MKLLALSEQEHVDEFVGNKKKKVPVGDGDPDMTRAKGDHEEKDRERKNLQNEKNCIFLMAHNFYVHYSQSIHSGAWQFNPSRTPINPSQAVQPQEFIKFWHICSMSRGKDQKAEDWPSCNALSRCLRFRPCSSENYLPNNLLRDKDSHILIVAISGKVPRSWCADLFRQCFGLRIKV